MLTSPSTRFSLIYSARARVRFLGFGANGGSLSVTFEENANLLFSEPVHVRFSEKQNASSLPKGVKITTQLKYFSS